MYMHNSYILNENSVKCCMLSYYRLMICLSFTQCQYFIKKLLPFIEIEIAPNSGMMAYNHLKIHISVQQFDQTIFEGVWN